MKYDETTGLPIPPPHGGLKDEDLASPPARYDSQQYWLVPLLFAVTFVMLFVTTLLIVDKSLNRPQTSTQMHVMAMMEATKPSAPVLTYPVTVLETIDGDTLKVNVDLGLDIHLSGVSLRLVGIDCPELPTKEGVEATNFTREWVREHQKFKLTLYKRGRDKYGRLLGTLHSLDGAVLNHDLLEAKQAVPLSD